MKPVAWQFKPKEAVAWTNGYDEICGSKQEMEDRGYETRDLYSIPEGYVVMPVEVANGVASVLRLMKEKAENAFENGYHDHYEHQIELIQHVSEMLGIDLEEME